MVKIQNRANPHQQKVMPLAVTSIEIQNVPRSQVQEGRYGQKKNVKKIQKMICTGQEIVKIQICAN